MNNSAKFELQLNMFIDLGRVCLIKVQLTKVFQQLNSISMPFIQNVQTRDQTYTAHY